MRRYSTLFRWCQESTNCKSPAYQTPLSYAGHNKKNRYNQQIEVIKDQLEKLRQSADDEQADILVASEIQSLETDVEKLRQEGIAHTLWLEQPENFPTAVALKPYPRERVASLLKKYQLFK